MSERLTYGQLLLILNYDTHGRKLLTLTQRCQIHKVLCDKAELELELIQLIQEGLQEVFLQGYTKRPCHYVEVAETGERVLIFEM